MSVQSQNHSSPELTISKLLMPNVAFAQYTLSPSSVRIRTELKKRIFVVEDQPVVRAGIVETLNREKDLAVCGEAEDAEPALSGIQQTSPDLVLTDIKLKSSSGIALIRELRHRHPRLAVVGMTMLDPIRYEKQARAAGADQFVVKQEGAGKILEAIRDALK
jgi:DNA-binding NarL/FixJ family response regulator